MSDGVPWSRGSPEAARRHSLVAGESADSPKPLAAVCWFSAPVDGPPEGSIAKAPLNDLEPVPKRRIRGATLPGGPRNARNTGT